MPYSSSVATRSITIQAVTISLTVSPATAKVGEVVTFSGTFSPAATAAGVVLIQMEHPSGTWNMVMAIPYNYGDTSFWGQWTVPYTHANKTLPCTTTNFRAVYVGVASSSKTLTVSYVTRIQGFTAPATVAPTAPFTAEGYLEYQATAASWQPLSAKTVSILYDGNTIGSATTGTDGKFSKTDCTIPTAGSYTLKASFGGTTASVGVRIIIEKLRALPTWQKIGIAALATITALAVIAKARG